MTLQVLVTEPPLNTKVNREKLVQLLFDKYKVPGVCLANTAILSLFCSGRTRGLTVRGHLVSLLLIIILTIIIMIIITIIMLMMIDDDDQLEVGGGVSHAVPIFEGYALPHATVRLDMGGQDITLRLRDHLRAKGQDITVMASTVTHHLLISYFLYLYTYYYP